MEALEHVLDDLLVFGRIFLTFSGTKNDIGLNNVCDVVKKHHFIPWLRPLLDMYFVRYCAMWSAVASLQNY